MDGARGYYAKGNKSVRERQIPYDFTYMWNLKNIRNEQTKLKQTHRHREQTDGCQRAGGFGDWVKKGEGSEKHKLNRGDKVQHRNIVGHTVRTCTVPGGYWKFQGNTV